MTEVIKFFGTKKISDSSYDERLSKNITNLYKNIEKSNLSHIIIPKFLISKKSKINDGIITDFQLPLFVRKIKGDNVSDCGLILTKSFATATLSSIKDDEEVFIQKPLQLPENNNSYSAFKGFLKTLVTIDGMYCLYNNSLSSKPQFFVDRFHYENNNTELYKTLELDNDIIISLITVNREITYLDVITGGNSESGKTIKKIFSTDGLTPKRSKLLENISLLNKDDESTKISLINNLSFSTKYPFADIDFGKNNKLFHILNPYKFNTGTQLGKQSDSYVLASAAYSILNTSLLRIPKYKKYQPYLFSYWYNSGVPIHTMMNISYNIAIAQNDTELADKIVNLSKWLNKVYNSIKIGDKESIKNLFSKDEISNFSIDTGIENPKEDLLSMPLIQKYFESFSGFFNIARNCNNYAPTNNLFLYDFVKDDNEIKLKNVFETLDEKTKEDVNTYEVSFLSGSSLIQMRCINTESYVVRLQTKGIRIFKNKILIAEQTGLEHDYEIVGNMENIKTIFGDTQYHNGNSTANTDKKYVKLILNGDKLVSEIGGLEIMSVKEYAEMCKPSTANNEVEKEIELIKSKL